MPSSGEDLVLYNGKVRTMDDRDSVVSASARDTGATALPKSAASTALGPECDQPQRPQR